MLPSTWHPPYGPPVTSFLEGRSGPSSSGGQHVTLDQQLSPFPAGMNDGLRGVHWPILIDMLILVFIFQF
eukprot:scaffold19663_cov13-Tisochrysis_lutea.AAC.1